MSPKELLVQLLAKRLQAGQQLGTLGQAGQMLASDVAGYAKDIYGSDQNTSSWGRHAMNYLDTARRADAEFAGWNRDSRDVKGYASGADYALRHPGKEEAASALAALYQGSQMPLAAISPGTSIPQEYADYQANKAGIQGAALFPGSNPDNPKVQEALYERARRYREAMNNRGR